MGLWNKNSVKLLSLQTDLAAIWNMTNCIDSLIVSSDDGGLVSLHVLTRSGIKTYICNSQHYPFYRQPTRCNNNGLLIIPVGSTCFGRWFRPSSGALDCVYSLWYNAPTMLLAGGLDAEEQQGHQMAMLSHSDSIAIWWPCSSSTSRPPASNIVGALYHKL